jgi:hypothetical protein
MAWLTCGRRPRTPARRRRTPIGFVSRLPAPTGSLFCGADASPLSASPAASALTRAELETGQSAGHPRKNTRNERIAFWTVSVDQVL